NPLFTKLIDSFLNDRTAKVRVGNTPSQPYLLRAGVPQGSVLSPLLYIIYTHDFPVSDTTNTKTRMFADDTAIWSSHRTPERARNEVQIQLNNVESWMNKWRIKANPTKSQYLQ